MSSVNSVTEVTQQAEKLFSNLDSQLSQCIDAEYFADPKEFRSLLSVLKVLGTKLNRNGNNARNDEISSVLQSNAAYHSLIEQQKIAATAVEGVVTFQHGGLNNSMDTMSDVINEYSKGRNDVRLLRTSLYEIRSVLTSRKAGQVSLRDLCLKKLEAQESLRILRDLEFLKDARLKIQRLIEARHYMNAVQVLNKGIKTMFDEDLINVSGITQLRDDQMELKEIVLDKIIGDLKEVIFYIKEDVSDDDNDGNKSDSDTEEAQQGIKKYKKSSNNNTGDSSSSGSNSNISYSFDVNDKLFDDATESMELTLTDPRASGAIFIRCIVKSIGFLNCEEDAERMLLEISGHKFKCDILFKLRATAINRRNNILSTYGNMNDSIEYIESKLFANYIGSLLDAAVLSLKRLFYVLRLLYLWRKHRTGDAGANDYKMKDANKRAISTLWLDIEQVIVDELKMHFIEKAVVDISNVTTGSLNNDSNNSNHRRTDAFNADTAIGIDKASADNTPIFTPSARLAAPVYKIIVQFDEVVRKLLIDEKVEKDESNSINIQPAMSANMSVLEMMNVNAIKSARVSAVLKAVQDVLEKELVPVVQSTINQTMRDIQLNSYYFALSTDSPYYPGVSTIPLCYATQLCFQSARPLFKYWLQLPNHRDMIVTILDRLIRGHASAAHEELETQTYKLYASQDFCKKAIAIAIRKDPSFTAYRYNIYNGKQTIDEMLSLQRGLGKSATAMEIEMYGCITDHSNALDLACWGNLWDVGLSPYPVNTDKISRDFTAISTVASILNGCDWFTREVCKACNASIKKLNIIGTGSGSGSGSGASASTYGRQSVKSVKKMQELGEIQVAMHQTIKDSCRELEKLSEEAIAILRGELQAVTFYYLHQIANLKFQHKVSGVGGAAGGDSDGDAPYEAESIVIAYSKHIQSFIDALLAAASPAVLAVLLSPLCSLIPDILMNCVRHLLNQKIQLGATAARDGDSSCVKVLLGTVISTQQSISNMIETIHFDVPISRRLNDIYASEMEKLRRYVSILDLKVEEVRNYIRDNVTEFSMKEYMVIWEYKVANDPFHTFWADAIAKHEAKQKAILADKANKSNPATATTVATTATTTTKKEKGASRVAATNATVAAKAVNTAVATAVDSKVASKATPITVASATPAAAAVSTLNKVKSVDNTVVASALSPTAKVGTAINAAAFVPTLSPTPVVRPPAMTVVPKAASVIPTAGVAAFTPTLSPAPVVKAAITAAPAVKAVVKPPITVSPFSSVVKPKDPTKPPPVNPFLKK